MNEINNTSIEQLIRNIKTEIKNNKTKIVNINENRKYIDFKDEYNPNFIAGRMPEWYSCIDFDNGTRVIYLLTWSIQSSYF